MDTINSFLGDRIKDRSTRRIAQYSLLFVGLTILYIFLRDSPWQGSTRLHTLMELLATTLALFVGIVALIKHYSKKENTILFIGVGFLGTAFLDGYHTIVTSSFFSNFFPSLPDALIPWSWIASRVFLSALLAVSYFAWRREERSGERGRVKEWIVYTLVGIMTLASFVFFAFYPLPRAYYPELFFGRPEEFVPAFFFLVALIGYLKKGLWKTDYFEHWLVLSLIVGFLGQALFMSFSFGLFDFQFDAAHALKKVSYILTLIGLLISMYYLFRAAEERKEKIEKQNILLQKAQKRTEEDKEQIERALLTAQKSEKELETAKAGLEEEVTKRTVELSQKVEELEKFQKVAVGRELKMMELKKEIEKFKKSKIIN